MHRERLVDAVKYKWDMQAIKPNREKRPWGEFVEFTRNTPGTVKLVDVSPHEATSLQRHQNRDEFWRIISGNGFVTIGSEKISVKEGSDHFVPHKANHRLEAGDKHLIVLEISFGKFDENDIERVSDLYGRVQNAPE